MKYTLRCLCGMAHTNTLSKIAHWYEDHRGSCPTDGFCLVSPQGARWSGKLA